MADITMPKMGFDMTEGTIVRWLKKVGDFVNKGEAVAEIETDKVTIEIESFVSGTLSEIVSPAGSRTAVGGVIARTSDGAGAPVAAPVAAVAPAAAAAAPVATPVAAVTHAAAPVAAGATGDVKHSPLAKRMAREQGLDLGTTHGIGPHGRIGREDLPSAMAGQPSGVAAPGGAGPAVEQARALG